MNYFYFYNRKYSITEKGEVTRLAFDDIRIQKYNGRCIKLHRHNKTKILKHYINRDGYACVTLYDYPNRRTFLVHHLVYIVFNLNITNVTNVNIGYDMNLTQINHIDGDKLNNYYKNLELVTLQQNIEHAVNKKLHNSQTKALYIDIYKDSIYLTTVWKFKGVSNYLYKYLNRYVNTGTLCSYCKQGKDYYGFTFKYKV